MKPVPKEPPKRPSVLQGLKGMFSYLCSKRLAPLLLWFTCNGIIVAVYSGFLPFFIDYSVGKDTSTDEFYGDIVMILFGIGEAVGGISIGYFLDKCGNRFGIVLTFIYAIVSLSFLLSDLFIL